MPFLVSTLVVIGVWQWMMGGWSTMVFCVDVSTLTVFSSMLSSVSVFESAMSLSTPVVFKTPAVLQIL